MLRRRVAAAAQGRRCRAMPIDDPTVLASLAESLADVDGVSETIEQIVTFAVEAIDTQFGGITLIAPKGRGFTTVGATDPLVAEADQLQYDLGEGPSIEAAVDVGNKVVV